MTNSKIKKMKAGVFIDWSNTFWALKNIENSKQWKLSYSKFKIYLSGKYNVQLFHYYGVRDEKPTSEKFKKHALKEKKFYDYLNGIGFEVVTKPLKYIKDSRTNSVTTKGDMDVEMTIGVHNNANDIELIVIVSGDSDYLEVIKQMHKNGKYIRVYAFKHSLAWEIKEFIIKNTRCSYTFLEDIKDELEF